MMEPGTYEYRHAKLDVFMHICGQTPGVRGHAVYDVLWINRFNVLNQHEDWVDCYRVNPADWERK